MVTSQIGGWGTTSREHQQRLPPTSQWDAETIPWGQAIHGCHPIQARCPQWHRSSLVSRSVAQAMLEQSHKPRSGELAARLVCIATRTRSPASMLSCQKWRLVHWCVSFSISIHLSALAKEYIRDATSVSSNIFNWALYYMGIEASPIRAHVFLVFEEESIWTLSKAQN